MRYRLPVPAASLVFLLTETEELGLGVGRPVGKPLLCRKRRIRVTEASKRERSAPQ